MAHPARMAPRGWLAPVSLASAFARRFFPTRGRGADDADALGAAAKLYLAAVVLAALAVALVALARATPPAPDRVALAFALSAATTLAGLFPLPFVARTKLALDTALLVAAVLAFEPASALVIAAAGVGLAQALRRQPWDQALFNTAQVALAAAGASGLLAAAGWRADRLHLDRPGAVLPALAAGLGLVLFSSALLGPIIALQTGSRLPQVWSGLLLGGGRRQAGAQLAEVGLGVLMAALAVSPLWPVALLLAQAGTICHVLGRRLPGHRGPELQAAGGD